MRYLTAASAALLTVLALGSLPLQAQAPAPIPPSTLVGTGRFKAILFRGVRGPDDSTVVQRPSQPFPWRRYGGGTESRLAILLTDTTSDWLGLAHGLRSIGIPFTITRDAGEAVRHRVVLVYPMVSGRTLDSASLHLLAQHPQRGGTLMATSVLGGLAETFGFATASESRARFEVRFDTTSPLTAQFTEARERTLRLGNRATQKATIGGTVGYAATREPPLATFDDGTAAITQRTFPGGGRAVAFGVDLGWLLHRGYNNRDDYIYRDYVNGFEPTLDVFLRLIQRIYTTGEPGSVVLSTVPGGRALSLVISHDIDYGPSMINAVSYAAMERDAGVRATYFVQTKYVTDWNDTAFFSAHVIRAMRTVDSLGGELASHSVSHSTAFRNMPLGTGGERYPSYQPRVTTRTTVRDATILGELRVSRFLIERFSGRRVTAFRPGHLRNPESLPEALESTGYLVSSSTTANTSLTHLPYALTYGRTTESETSIFEFPVTVEDEATPLRTRLPATLRLASQVSRYGGLFMVLIHPDVLGDKLAFERGLLDALKPTVWTGSLGELADFWRARDATMVDVRAEPLAYVVHLSLPLGAHDLALRVPATWTYEPPAGATHLTVRVVSAGVVVVDAPAGKVSLRFVVAR